MYNNDTDTYEVPQGEVPQDEFSQAEFSSSGYSETGYPEAEQAAASPIDLSAASPELAELSRFIGRGCHVAVPSLEPDATLRMRASDAADADWSGALLLRGAFGAIEIAQGARLLRAFCRIDLEGETGDPARWTWLQAAVLGRLSDTPLQIVEAIDFGSADFSDDVVTVALSLQSDTHVIHTHARADAASLLAFLKDGQWQRVRQPLSELLALRCEATVSVARHELPADALAGIAAGDIIVPDSPTFTCDGEGALRVGPMQVRVRYEAPGLLAVTALEEKVNLSDDECDLTEEDFLPPALPGTDGLGGPLTLDFELGKVHVTLGELRHLNEGAVLPFEGGSPASIAIVSAGGTLGRGEIVEVDGQVAIRVTQWSVAE